MLLVVFIGVFEKVAVKLFDVVLFMSGNGIANHAGIYLDEYRFLHCTKAGVVVSKFSVDRWAKNVVGYYRVVK